MVAMRTHMLGCLLVLTLSGAGGTSDLELRDAIAELRLQLETQQKLIEGLQQQAEPIGQANHGGHGSNGRRLNTVDELASAMDHMWLILCGALVMFMQAGFAMVEAGACRAKNVQNILMKNLTDVCFGTLGWWSFGYAFAYGGPYNDDGLLGNKFAGSRHFFGMGFNTDTEDGTIVSSPKVLSWFFQWAFCSAAATIVSGGVAERVRFGGYAIYSLVMTAFIYPFVVAWTWGYGWMVSDINNIGFMDFAGSGIVHMTGGVGALVGAVVAGPRFGRWEKPDEFVPHSLPLIVLGTFILWFGWYGFNCGSTLGLHDSATGMLAAQVAMNTTISAASGGISAFCLRLAMIRLYDIGALCNGILAGLVAITAGCGNVESGSAFFIGLVGGVLYVTTSMLMKKIKIDDPLDAFAVHGVNGMWGVLAAGLFDWGKGFDHVHGWSGWDCMRDDAGVCLKGAGGKLFVANLVEVLAICAWVAVLSAMVFIPLLKIGFLKADDDQQQKGMDTKHSPPKAYVMERDWCA